MKIGIDCRTILNPGFGEHAGVGHYTYYLVTNLLKIDKKNDYVLFFDELLNREAASRIIGDRLKTTIKFFPFHEYYHNLLPEYSRQLISAFMAQERLNLLHMPSPILYSGYSGKNIITLHDLALFRYPEWFEKKELKNNNIIKKAVKNVDKIISISEFIKKEAIDIFRIPQEKIKVIYNGVDTTRHFLLTEDILSADDVVDLEDLEKKYGIGKNYILCLGTIEPRKNIKFLIEAFESLIEKDNENLSLVIAGLPGLKSKEILSKIKEKEKKYKNRIKYIGYVHHNDKFALIKNAACLVNISLYEGFSLQVLEGMEIGTPLVVSNGTSFPEIVGKAALLVDAESPEEIKNFLEKIIKEKSTRETIIKEGIKRAQSFNWEKTAMETLDFYKEAC